MAVKECTQACKSFLSSFQTALNQSWNLAPEYLQQFKKNQLEFYQQMSNLTSHDIQDLDHICTSLNEVVQKTKEVESRFLVDKNNSHPEQHMVKVLRSIADSFRSGEEDKALNEFKRSIGEGSLAGDVYGCLWKVRGRPNYDDFGKFSFNNAKLNCVSTPLQKALAIEMAMVGVIRKAFEQGQADRAYAEFHELPYRLKEAIFQVFAQKQSLLSDLEQGRKSFFGEKMEAKTKIDCLIAYQNTLERVYSRASESDHVRMLQRDVQREEPAFKHPNETKLELFEQLRSIQLAALLKLQQMQSESNGSLQNQISSLKNQNWYQYTESLTLKAQINQLEIENEQLKATLYTIVSLEKKKSELFKAHIGEKED